MWHNILLGTFRQAKGQKPNVNNLLYMWGAGTTDEDSQVQRPSVPFVVLVPRVREMGFCVYSSFYFLPAVIYFIGDKEGSGVALSTDGIQAGGQFPPFLT